jgi:hypothetical protein
LWKQITTPPCTCDSKKIDEKGSQFLGSNCCTLSLGNINIETWSFKLGVGRKAKTSLYKKIVVAKLEVTPEALIRNKSGRIS